MALVVPVPTISVIAMLFEFPGTTGKIIAAACKLWLVLLPLVWLVKIEKQRPRVAKPPRNGMVAGVISGAIILGAMLGTYLLLRHAIDLESLREKAAATGFAQLGAYIGIFVYIVAVNSLLEEYVWRWFICRQLETVIGTGSRWARSAAVAGAAAMFTIHHVFALAAWVDWRFNALACLGVFVGAAVWSWLYLRYRSIWPAYVSHVFADVAVFIMGYQLIFA